MTPEDNYREFREIWLRLCKNIAQAGKPVLLNSAGEPRHFEQCVERRYCSAIHYLALVCDNETLRSRLRSRPVWRKFPSAQSIEPHLLYNRWLKRDGQNTLPSMTLIDTSKLTIDESVDEVERWVKSRLT